MGAQSAVVAKASEARTTMGCVNFILKVLGVRKWSEV
jgi:hypothetical protein